MTKVRTTLTIDEGLWKAVRARAAQTGKKESDVIESALRRYLGLDLLERIWTLNDMAENKAMELALKAQNSVRHKERT